MDPSKSAEVKERLAEMTKMMFFFSKNEDYKEFLMEEAPATFK
jgi:hypothetical protein